MTGQILKKELKVLWASPLPYVLGAVFHATLGVLGWSQITSRGLAVFQPIVPVAGFLVVLVAPILSARSFADEIRSGTLELLLAIPVPNIRLVVGKYAAVVLTLWAMIVPAGSFVLVLSMWGDPDRGPMVTGLVGLGLLAAALGGVGLLASSLTASQPVAAIGALFAVLALWFAHVGGDTILAGDLLVELSISERLRSFAGGALDVADAAFFASVASGSLAGAVAALESRRWR